MTRWRQVQADLINRALRGEKTGIIQHDIAVGRIYGTIYYRRDLKPSRGVVIVHGFSGNRHSMGFLAERLAEYGLFCLSIDLPAHFLNPGNFSVGEVSETVAEGVLLMRAHFGIARIAVIGHSMGAVGTLFSSAGYIVEIEKRIYAEWNNLERLVELESKASAKQSDASFAASLAQKIEQQYTALKQMILYSLKKGIQEHSNVTCYIMLAPPKNCQAAFPGVILLKNLSHKWQKRIIEAILHKPAVKQIYKEGNLVHYAPENRPDNLYFQFFKTADAREFIDYITKMKEPVDFLKLTEKLAKFRHNDGFVNFFEYYQKSLLAKPKLFIYGKFDKMLAPLPFMRAGLERFYESCGNAEVHSGSFTHVMMNEPKQQAAALVLKNDSVTELIMRFLDRHL
jgi:hypothetical protein